MNSSARLIACLLILLGFACGKQEGVPEDQLLQPAERGTAPADRDDTASVIPTGARIPVSGKDIDPDSAAKAVRVPLKRRPQSVPMYQPNTFTATSETFDLIKPLPDHTPGENGVQLPDTLPAEIRVVPAFQPEPTAAGLPAIRDDAQFDIRYLDARQGMNASYILSMLEDKRGYLWFGTLSGLSRYDGQSFSHYTTEEGLLPNWVNSLLEDRDGNIWFRNMTGGISRYDGRTFTHYKVLAGLARSSVSSLVADQRGNIWLGTDQGLFCLARDQFIHYTVESGLSHNRINALFIDRDDYLWIGTQGGGVTRFNLRMKDGKGNFIHLNPATSRLNENISAIYQDEQGRIWFGGEKLSVFDGHSFTHYTTRYRFEIRAIREQLPGTLLLISEIGLTIFDGQRFRHLTKAEGLTDNRTWSIMQDRLGRTWLGSAGSGVSRLNSQGFVFFNEATGLNNSRVRSIFEDRRGHIWFGTRGGGLSRFDPDAGQGPGSFTYYSVEEGLSGSWVLPIVEDRKNRLWFGTDNGISRFEPDLDGRSGYFTNFTVEHGLSHNYNYSMLEDADGNMWFGNDGGVSRFDGEKFTLFGKEEGMIDDVVWSMSEDHHGDLWFGTRRGLTRFEPDATGTTGYFTHFTTAEGLSDNVIWSILEDSQHRIWLGTNRGLNLFDGTSFTHFTVEDGLSHDAVRSIVEDQQHRIWVSTDNGISLLVPDIDGSADSEFPTKSDYRIYTFGTADGLKRTHFDLNAAFLDSKNRIWWGSIDGATMLDLNKFELPDQPPRQLQLASIEIGQQYVDFRRLVDSAYTTTLSFAKTIGQSFDSIVPFQNYPYLPVFPHALNHLTFHFSAIDWQAPHQLQYSYMLEGIDQDWSPLSPENKADYRNLPPGLFTLKVKAIGAAQQWSEPFLYTFTIRPPWWQSWWAYSIYLLLAILLLSGLYFYQRRRWQLQTALEVEQEKAQRLKELDHFKSRFYTNITHEFRTPLTVIKGMAGQIREDKVRQMIRRNSDRLLGMINQLLDLSKLEKNSLQIDWIQSDIIPYLQYLTESCHSLAENKKLNLAFFSKTDQLIMDFDEVKMQHILINLVSNAIKFTPEYGSVKVITDEVSEKEIQYLKLIVQDTGAGIPPDQLPHIFDRFYQVDNSATRQGEGSGIGLALVQELVRLLGGRIKVESQVDKGSSFKVWLPIHRNASVKDQVNGPGVSEIGPLPGSETALVSGAASIDPDAPQILVIEDNADVVEYIFHCLENRYLFQSAVNGKAGLEKALETIPDIIICDVMMPEMDGFEVCRQLKSDHRTSHIPIILLTAKATQEDKLTGLSQGADAYLTKPFDRRELLIRIEQLTQLSKRLREALADPAGLSEHASAGEQKEAAFLEDVNHIIDNHLADDSFNTHRLCLAIAMSRAQLYRKLKAVSGHSTAQYIRTFRLRRAKTLLETTDLPIGEIAQKVGFKDFSHFSRSFAREFDQKPSDTRI